MSKDTSEDVRSKGLRYLAESRLTIRDVGPGDIRATCKGDGAVYQVGWDRGRGWSCTCPAFTRCAHEVALGLVTGTMTGPPLCST